MSRAERGTSLVEVMIGMVLTAIILSAYFSAVENTQSVQRESGAKREATTEAERVLSMISADLRRASKNSLEGNGDSLVLRKYVEVGGDPVAGIEPTLVISPDAVIYKLDPDRGLLRSEGTFVQVVAPKVVGFDAQIVNSSLVTLAVEAQVPNPVSKLDVFRVRRESKVAVLVP